ncbi:biotin/lipoyl-binding protein, partial [Vibrio splendidus]
MIKSSVTYGVLSLVLFVFSLSHYNIDVVSSGDGVISITDSNINITSPISGEIQSLNVSQGDSVDIGEKMISIKNIEDKHNLELMKERREIYKIKSDYLKYERELLGNIFLSGTFHLDENNPSGEDVLGNSLLIGVEKTISARLLRLREQYRFYLSRKLFFEKN